MLAFLKKKNNPPPSVLPLVFTTPQNYNVQIHICVRRFCTLEINTGENVAVVALRQRVFVSRSGFGPRLLSVCPSVFTQPHTSNHATDYYFRVALTRLVLWLTSDEPGVCVCVILCVCFCVRGVLCPCM